MKSKILLPLIALLLTQVTCSNKKTAELAKGLDFNLSASSNVVDGQFWSCAAYASAVLSGTAATADVETHFAFFPSFQLHWKTSTNETLWVSSIKVTVKNPNINNDAEFEYVITGQTLFALLGSPNGSIPPNASVNSQDPNTRPYMRGNPFSDGTILPATGVTYSSCGLTISGIPIDEEEARPFSATASIELTGFAIDMSSASGGQRPIRLKKQIRLDFLG